MMNGGGHDERLAADGSDVGADTPEEFTAFVRAEVAKWGRIARQAHIKAE
jgi:tripartite-type tricarboxylate transporter receptor subunit TctC